MPETTRTERSTLRQPREGDAEPLAALIGDWEAVRMPAIPPYSYTVDDARGYYARTASNPWQFVIQADRPIGVVGLSGLLGYWLGKPWWGRGYATEAAAVALDAWLVETDADAILAGAFVENTASQNGLAKMGFCETGRGPRHSNGQGVEADQIGLWLSPAGWAARRRPAESVAP